MHDPTEFPNIYYSKKKAQHIFCSFRFKVSIHNVFHQQSQRRLFVTLTLNPEKAKLIQQLLD